MRITITVANISIANYYKEGSTYVSSISINSISSKKGLAIDSLVLSLDTEVLNVLNLQMIYLFYNTLINVYVEESLVLAGYVSKINNTSDSQVKLDITSTYNWHSKQFVAPSINALCQNQIYSKNCGLNATNFKISFSNVKLNCFTGSVSLSIDKTAHTITLGDSTTSIDVDNLADGNLSLYDGNTTTVSAVSVINNPMFYERSNWWNTIVIVNSHYRGSIVNVTDKAIYLDINYLNLEVQLDTVDIYLKCDKTYGDCYSRFNNIQHFWGFPNNGKLLNTIDIFSAENLDYCGEDIVDQEFEYCDTDFNIFGVNLND